jgi:hypothetical protein
MTDPWCAAAAHLAGPVSTVGAAFMSSRTLQDAARTAGVEFIAFYVAGRAGVLGDNATAQDAIAALVFFEPDLVTAAWRTTAGVPRHEWAARYAAAAAEFAESRPSGQVDWARLRTLATRVVVAAPRRPESLATRWADFPLPTVEQAAASQTLNVLRELRMRVHADALADHGVGVHDAVRHRSPALVASFGWSAGDVAPGVVARWDAAQAATDAALAELLGTLAADELAELVGLVDDAHRAWTEPPVRA